MRGKSNATVRLRSELGELSSRRSVARPGGEAPLLFRLRPSLVSCSNAALAVAFSQLPAVEPSVLVIECCTPVSVLLFGTVGYHSI